MKTFTYKKAFTALEVILVLLLAGLLYIYTTNKNTHAIEKESYKSGARIAYSTLNKSASNIITQGGFTNKFQSEKEMVDFLIKEMRPIRVCSSAKTDNCWSKTWLWGDKEKPGIQLKGLQFVTVDFVSSDCSYSKNIPNTCGFVYIDSNGPAEPNEIGKDILLFYMTRQGFIPAGTQYDTITPPSYCDLKNDQYNWGCTAVLLGLK